MAATQNHQTVTKQSAIVGVDDGSSKLIHDAKMPKATGDMVIIETRAVSVNPVDTKMVGAYTTAGAVAGFDFAGVVVELGPDAGKHGFKVGDRVCSTALGMNPNKPEVGAFAQYTASSEWILIHLPDDWSFEAGASLGISFLTVGMALFWALQLPGRPLEPTDKPTTVLVFGGSSSSGAAALQVLKLAGYTTISTCSPRSFEYVRSLGASEVWDYAAEDTPAKIRAHTKNGLRWALDCISNTGSMQFCYQVLGRTGGRYCSLEPYSEAVAQTRKVVKPHWVMGPSLLGQEVKWPEPHYRAADPVLTEFATHWAAIVDKLLNQGLIIAPPLEVRDNGLDGVLQGIDDVREARVRGKRLVFSMA